MKPHSNSIRVGVDIGETFTDVVAITDAGGFFTVKTPSIPADPAKGVIEGLALLAEMIGVSLQKLLVPGQRLLRQATGLKMRRTVLPVEAMLCPILT